MLVFRRVSCVGMVALTMLGLGASPSVRAQVLARRNWEGSGVKVQAWWARGVFCAGGEDVRRVVGEIDALERVGCDVVEVDLGGKDLGGGDLGGLVEELDGLIEAAGRRRMRVVLDLDGAAGERGLRERVGFWGARGVAGFAIQGVGDGMVGRLRQETPGRLWIGEGGQLRVVSLPEGDAATVRAGLAGRLGAGVLLDSGRESIGYGRATMLLLSGMAVRIGLDAVLGPAAPIVAEETREFSAEEMLLWVPKASVAGNGIEGWFQELSELHHQNGALRTGQAVFLDLDSAGVVGWVVPGRDGRAAIVVACNLTGKAVRVAVAMRVTGVRGNLLKTVLRSDGSAGVGDSLEGIQLGAGGVFVGELR